MTDFQVGQNLVHPEHGPCIVTFVGQDYIGVEFACGSNALVRKEAFNGDTPKGGTPGLLTPEQARQSMPWPESTFVIEPPATRHFMGSHWKPFGDDGKEILSRLPEIVPKASLWMGIDGINATKSSLPNHWMPGLALAWPSQRQGLMLALIRGSEANEIASLFPFFTDGSQHTLRLLKVIVWDGGAEAQIEAGWGKSEITFFDVGFLVNRHWYEADRDYEFILCGIAYVAQPTTVKEFPFKPHPDQVAWQHMLAEKRGERLPIPKEKDILSMTNAAVFLPVEGWDRDDYRFQGRLKSIKEIVGDVLGQTGWVARTTVMKFGEEDADLDILITRRAWQGDSPPSIGQNIEGSIWLQGYLWDVPKKHL
ncbi:MAG TPA: hypothetical protein P5244_03800 [Syntrophales bacterium]|nr:hypothetical protein [Syntrophales bacterium]